MKVDADDLLKRYAPPAELARLATLLACNPWARETVALKDRLMEMARQRHRHEETHMTKQSCETAEESEKKDAVAPDEVDAVPHSSAPAEQLAETPRAVTTMSEPAEIAMSSATRQKKLSQMAAEPRTSARTAPHTVVDEEGINCEPAEITRLTNDAGPLTKVFRLGKDGSLQRETAAFLSEGTAETLTVITLKEFANIIKNLGPNQALAYGVTGHQMVRVVCKRQLQVATDAIARDREHFAFRRGPGILMLDVDAGHCEQRFENLEELRAVLIGACQDLADAPMMGTLSASSCIKRMDTDEDVTGVRGQRLYILIADASDIPRAGRALYERLWLAGCGRYVVSKSGTLLDRNLIDGSVFQPERIDFAAGAMCEPPLVQRRPEPTFWGDQRRAFDTRRIRELTEDEKKNVERLRGGKKEALADEAREVREAFIRKEARELSARSGTSVEQATRIISDAVSTRVLSGEFLLHPQDGEPVSVSEVLDNPGVWDGTRFADPIEPDYRHDRRVAWCSLRGNGKPYLYSHAHGGRTFTLESRPVFRVESGGTTRLTDEVLDALKRDSVVYDRGTTGMARVASGVVYPVDALWLRDHLGRIVRFRRFDGRAKAWKDVDPPFELVQTVLARNGGRARTQLVVATRLRCAERSTSLSASAGVRHPRVFLGRVFNASATACSSLLP